jgi:hypothetical protein
VQWDREPELDADGNVIGFKDTMKVTPSHLLTIPRQSLAAPTR